MDLAGAIRTALAAHSDPERAAGQQRYMKSALPYRGLASAELKATLRPLLADPAYRFTSRAGWEGTVRMLWDEAAYREERYAATALAGHRAYRAWQDPETLRLYRHLIVTGAWWDHVDDLASHHVGDILAAHRVPTTRVLREWMVADDLWLRRTAILAQLRHRGATDGGLLRDALEANLEGSAFGREFFIRKAVGWALRQHARTDPAWVRGFVAEHSGELSGLSTREALKHLGGPGEVAP
jgi:3-methyladenine DNA glycosylase AlkD